MALPKDDFKWFGEGFDGFPKSLPEDCVEYTIYVLDSKLEDLEIQEHLRGIHTAANRLTQKLLRDFIWQREGIQLELKREAGKRFLRGRTNYGDSVEDEWLIVYILRELSKQFPKIWIRIVDTDGQFLLIEAANVLPRWLNPEIADFRVWLNSGRLLIVPLQKPRAEVTQVKQPDQRPLTFTEALQFIQSRPSGLLHSPEIESEAFYRLQKYPKQIQESLHHALVTLPRKLAYILHDKAAYVSPAVEAFYLRDPIALRQLQAPGPTGLEFPPLDLVTTSVKFTKVGYAQLKSQQFVAPASWAAARSTQIDLKSQEMAEMGMKITCGFEMLISDPQNQDRKAVREIRILLDDLGAGEDDLPSDAEIRSWVQREDDETWLNINFEEFEKELNGRGRQSSAGMNGGFGNKGAQENLRKMVSRFEDFLNDDTAGAEGAEFLDEMDQDDDESTRSDSDAEGEDRDVSFDEGEFARMMREMMGMPTELATAPDSKLPGNGVFPQGKRVTGVSSTEEGELGVRQAMHEIEEELRDAGALDLNESPNYQETRQRKAIYANSSSTGQSDASADGEKAEEGEVDIDFNLAKNILESFKSQGGLSGPGGNLMGLMGTHLPRDE